MSGQGNPSLLPVNVTVTICSRRRKALDAAYANMSSGYSEELIAVDINLAMEHIGSILGKTFAEDLLDKIFGEFCIGK